MIKFKKLVSISFVLLLVVSFSMVFSGGIYAADKPAADSKAGKININTANKEQLMKLPRIGDKISDRIIEYRQKNGKFKRLEDIMKVSGIGEKTFQQLKDLITM